MVNIAEILENAPKGIELYSPIYGKCKFTYIQKDSRYPVRLSAYYSGEDVSFTEDGRLLFEYKESECLLFPSKEHKTWDGWQKVLFPKSIGCVVKYDAGGGMGLIVNNHQIVDSDNIRYKYGELSIEDYRYATIKESQQFFLDFEEHGYKWDSDKKAIISVKKQWKPKVGDTMTDKRDDNPTVFYKIISENDGCFIYMAYSKSTTQPLGSGTMDVNFVLQNFKKYEEGNPDMHNEFTFNNLKPFDNVLVRCGDHGIWECDIFSYYDDSDKSFPYVVISGTYSQCVPYNDETKHLVGTTQEYNGQYKTW